MIRKRGAYEDRLAGERTEDTLLSLDDAFGFVGNLLDPPRPQPPHRAKERRLKPVSSKERSNLTTSRWPQVRVVSPPMAFGARG